MTMCANYFDVFATPLKYKTHDDDDDDDVEDGDEQFGRWQPVMITAYLKT